MARGVRPVCVANPIHANGVTNLVPPMNVLIVEDHEDTRHVLERFLSRKGYDVTIADNGQNGLSLLQTNRFEAIVSDIMLPDGTGYGLMSEARRHGVKRSEERRVGKEC